MKNPTSSFSLLLAICFLFLAPVSIFAAQSTFTTSLTTTGVADIIPPTVPSDLTAIGVSSTQIDLSWTASTDNFSVAGYRIFRDSVFLATTTGTAYADGALTPETQYGYSVEAFDPSFNFSGQSAQVFATTTAAPVPPAPPAPSAPNGSGSSGSGSNQLQITGIAISPGLDQAQVSFATDMPAQTKVYWGITPDTEAGTLSDAFYSEQHQTVLTGLDQGTHYYVRIEATDSVGFTVSADTDFTTSAAPALAPLPNPSGFAATAQTDLIHLGWSNPSDPRFQDVRIVRSDTFFPRDPNDGVPVYEGSGASFDDHDAAVDQTYYYAIFAEGSDGLFSSGALAQARIAKPGEAVAPGSQDPFANIPQSALTDPKIAALTLADFGFMQEGKTLFNSGHDTIAINGSEDLTISLAYDKVPEILKTIGITLSDPQDPTKVFPFLLRVNAAKTDYEATIGPLGRSGNYALNIVVLDYQNQGLKRIQGNVRALAFAGAVEIPKGFDPLALMFVVLLAILFAILFIVARRRRNAHSDTSRGQGTIQPQPAQAVHS